MAVAPQGMAVDASGNLFFVSLNCVFKLDQNGIVTRVAGNSRTGYSGDGGPALSAMFNTPSGLAVDAGGNIYVADLINRRIRKVSPAGIVTTFAGTGVFGYSGDGGPAAAANLNGPSNVAVDYAGNLYIVDGARIREISTAGIITTVAGNGVNGFSGDGGPATLAELSPYGVAADGKGNIYISDDGNLRVRMVSPAGIITTVAGNGSYGYAGDGGPATAAQLTGASGIAIDSSGDLYFSDSSPLSDDIDCYCVRKVTPAGIITTVSAGANLFEPRALALNAGGDLYIADTGNYGISKVASTGTITVAAGYLGAPTYSGDAGPATGAQLNQPWGLATDGGGNVYIGDTFNNRVRVVSPAGIITTIAGNGVPAYAGDGSPAANSEVYYPVGVAADSLGNLYIADHGNGRIRKISKSGIITSVDLGSSSVSSGQVWGVAVDSKNNLYVPDPSNNRINRISPDGTVTTVAGNGTFGFSGDGGPATSAQIQLTFKAALTTDRAGNLYFSDDGFQPPAPGTIPGSTASTPRIRKVAPDGTITTVAGNGTSGYSGDGGPATQAQLGAQDYRVALAADNAGNLFIADGDNFRVRMVSTAGIITTIAGTGVSGYTGDGGPAVAAQLNGPSALAVDSAGNLYVADQGNNVVRLMQPVSSSISVTGVTNAASGMPGPIAPGEIVVVSGSGLGPAQLVSGAAGSDGMYSDQLAGTTVQFNGVPAPLIYTWATQVAVVVPYSIVSGSAQIRVDYQGQTSAALTVPVASSAPGIFTLDSSGKGQAVALNPDSSVNSAAAPANAGDVISLFATGEGETTPAGVDGQLATSPVPQPILPVRVTIGGQTVKPVHAGGVLGDIAGVMRIDVQIPTGIQAGPGVPVVLQVGTNSSQPGITIAIQ
ncbi:MAG: hypothetical protein ABSB35_32580 [Bryobacteraceae bacterium]